LGLGTTDLLEELETLGFFKEPSVLLPEGDADVYYLDLKES
jgi:hypothetical protein